MGERRVVVTGLGAVTPLGTNVASFWDGLVSARSGIGPVQRFDASPFDSRVVGECLDFNPSDFIDPRVVKRMDRFAQLGYAASKMAFEDTGLKKDDYEPGRAGVILGTGIGGLDELECQHKRLINKGPGRVSAFTIPKLMANATTGHVSIEFDLRGVSAAVATACASAGNAISEAFYAIRSNRADLMFAGGTEGAVTPLGLAAFAAMKAITTRNDEPDRASRPFDKDRDGFILAEGAGVLILEDLEHARKRGAHIHAELIGVGTTSDARDMVQPDPEGRGAAAAMAAALADAGVNPEDVHYINAHGTSTPLGDIAETIAIKSVFGPAAKKVAISSTKSAIGHTLGASGGIEAVACIKAIENKTIPPTLNLDNPDPQCDLDYVPKEARDADVTVAMSNSFGFGGHNACLVFRRM